MIVTLTGAYGYAAQQADEYESTSAVQLLWDRQNDDRFLPELETSTSRLTSPVISERVAEILDGSTDVRATSVEVEQDFEAAYLTISVTGPDETTAQRTADAYATAIIDDLQAQADDEVAGLDERRDELRDDIVEFQEELADDPEDQLAQAELDVALQSYASLSNQIDTITFAAAPAELAEAASPARSTALGTSTVLALGGLIGLLAGIGIALLRNEFNTRVRHARDLSSATDVQLLAEIPRHRSSPPSPYTLPVTDPRLSPFTSGIRALRTAIQVLVPKPGAVIVVTSPEPTEGKTFIAANLAASGALSGKHTVLVCGDLRQPELDKYFTEHNQHDLRITNGAAGSSPAPESASSRHRSTAAPRENADEQLRGTAIERLMLYPALTTEDDPADLLATPLFRQLIDDLRQRADVVIIDTPPVLAVPDPLILGGYADGVVVVTRAKRSTKTALTKALDQLFIDRVPVLGLVLNGTPSRSDQNYARYYGERPRV
jgi:Mrp family chromosome partitioning ATPase